MALGCEHGAWRIVTLEDSLKSIGGDIRDEHDPCSMRQSSRADGASM